MHHLRNVAHFDNSNIVNICDSYGWAAEVRIYLNLITKRSLFSCFIAKLFINKQVVHNCEIILSHHQVERYFHYNLVSRVCEWQVLSLESCWIHLHLISMLKLKQFALALFLNLKGKIKTWSCEVIRVRGNVRRVSDLSSLNWIYERVNQVGILKCVKLII